MPVSTTKMSSRGQVVIPEEIRERAGLREGSQFVVLHHGDTVVLKIISEPSTEEFQEMLKTVRAQVRKAGLKKSDLTAAIKRVRRGR